MNALLVIIYSHLQEVWSKSLPEVRKKHMIEYHLNIKIQMTER